MSGRRNIDRIKKFTNFTLKMTLLLLILKIIGIIHCSFLVISLPILIPVSIMFIVLNIFIIGWGFVIVSNEIKYKKEIKK